MYALGINIGPWHVAIVLIIVIILFGPKQLPKLAKMFRETAKEVREGLDEAEQTTASVQQQTAPPPAPAPAATEAAPAPAAEESKEG